MTVEFNPDKMREKIQLLLARIFWLKVTTFDIDVESDTSSIITSYIYKGITYVYSIEKNKTDMLKFTWIDFAWGKISEKVTAAEANLINKFNQKVERDVNIALVWEPTYYKCSECWGMFDSVHGCTWKKTI